MEYETKKSKKTEYEIIHHTKISSLAMIIIEIFARSVHCHSDLEVGMLIDGSVDLMVDNKVFKLKKNDVFIVNRYQPHSFYSHKSHNMMVIFMIDQSLYKNISPDIRYIYFDNHIPFNKKYSTLYEAIFECALSYASELQFSAINVGGKALEIIYQLTEIANPVNSEYSARQSRSKAGHLKRITEFISEHHAENISLKDIAEAEDLSTWYISHFIKKMTGMSFTAYLNNIRFDHAYSLITKTDLRISDICTESGFSDSRYLNRLFLEKTGSDVRTYRKNTGKIQLPITDRPYITVQNHMSFNKFEIVLKKYYEEIIRTF